MAKKQLTDLIIKLYSKLGGNVSEVLGTRTNINFLGVGKSPEGFIDSTINVDAIGALGQTRILDELKSSMGYLTANKLNDVQATKLYENMLKIDNVFNPAAAPANIVDLGTGTRNLTEEGLGALRATRKTDDDLRVVKDDYMTDEGVMASETILPLKGAPKDQPQTIADRISEYIKKVREEKSTPWATDKPIDDFHNYVLKGQNVGGAGPLDPVTGLTRTLARRILDKKGIEIGKGDPLDVFTEKFSGQVLTDVKNLAEGMLEAEKAGTKLKSMDELLEIEGLFDIKLIKDNPYFNPPFKHGGLAKILEV